MLNCILVFYIIILKYNLKQVKLLLNPLKSRYYYLPYYTDSNLFYYQYDQEKPLHPIPRTNPIRQNNK